jgi:TonB-linked SusC/RagA family outer membrane protein
LRPNNEQLKANNSIDQTTEKLFMNLIKIHKSFILNTSKQRRRCFAIYTCLIIMLFHPQILKAEDIKNVKINAHFSNVNIESALQQLQSRCSYVFTYNAELLPKKKTITASFSNEPLNEVLDFVLRNTGLSYSEKNKYIFILPAPSKLVSKLQNKVTGTVKDTTGTPLPGVTILIKGNSIATTTDKDGRFSLAAKAGDQLIITMVGYRRQEITIGDETVVNVLLKEAKSSLSEVVVVGYGTQKRTSLTGAVSSVSAELINALPVPNIAQALQGRVAGLNVINNGGPGAAPIIQIRGVSSINGSSSPFYVIDGVPAGNLASFDNADILNVEVLKDASAAAIYGSRATNGVILITTRKGSNDKLKIELNSFAGVEETYKRISLLNTSQYLQYERVLNGNAGIGLPPRLQSANFNLPLYPGTSQTFAETNTDWQDAYFKSGLLTRQNISLSAGNEISRFYSSAGYFKQDGIVQGLGYQRGNFRINSDHKISKVVTFGENLYLVSSRQRSEGATGTRSKLVNVIRSLPYLPVYDPTTNGGYRGAENSVDGSDPTNPIEDAVLLGDNNNNTSRLFGSTYLNFEFTPWLAFRSTFGIDHSEVTVHGFSPIYDDKGRSATVATINDQKSNNDSFLYTQQLSLNKTFGQHHINFTGVYETQDGKSSNVVSSGSQATNIIQTFAGATNINLVSTKDRSFLVSYVGRLNYEFANKYLISAAIRRDGYSAWAPGHKYATFPSASIGWRINEEHFMKKISAISELKLRAGFGLTGLASVGNYAWQALVNENAATYPFNNTLTVGNATYYNQLGNKELEWEKTKQLNIGIDLGLYTNKFTLSAEYYKRQTNNLILQVPTPMSFGLNKVGVFANVGSMYNSGFDFQLGYHERSGALKYDITGIISSVRNKVLALNSTNAILDAGADASFGSGYAITRTQAGQPIQSFYGFVTDGIFQSQEQVDQSPVQVIGKTAPGDIKFKDLNNDGIINSDDRTFLGSNLPKFNYSLNFAASYNNFDVSIFLQGVQGNKVYNGARVIQEGMTRLYNAGNAVLNAWTPTNTNTAIPRAISGDPNQNSRTSDRWLESGSFLRFKNLTLGYNIPKSGLKKFLRGSITNVRIYIASQNLLTLTKYKGWDPEIGYSNGTLTSGVDYGQYPSARSFSLGLQVGL